MSVTPRIQRRHTTSTLLLCLGFSLFAVACSDDIDGEPAPGEVMLENNGRGDMAPGSPDMNQTQNDQGIGTPFDLGTPGLVDMSAPLADMEPVDGDMSSPDDMRTSDMGSADMPLSMEDMSAPLDMTDDIDMITDIDMGAVEDMGTGPADMATMDMAPAVDMAPPQSPCISGAMGAHVVRFHWEGNGPGSRAYVVYDENTLPDTTRWKAGAYGRTTSYSPVYDDTFLAQGGLVLSSTNFMHVEISTAMMPTINNATIAIYGRSYNTTSPGSFSWLTFSGSGSSPYGMVANSAPYQWYTADATAALPAGDAGTLVRIEAQGPSNRLIVNAVEICFDI